MTILGTRLIPDIFWAGSEDEAGCARVRKRKGERKDDGGKGGWWVYIAALQLAETEGGT